MDGVISFFVEQWGLFLGGLSAAIGAAVYTMGRQALSGAGRLANSVTRSGLGTGKDYPLRAKSIEINVVIRDAAGTDALFSKTQVAIIAAHEMHSYTEAIAASGKVTEFSTDKGAITRTHYENGYWLSEIDLGTPLRRGAEFKNTFRAKLTSTFTEAEEDWVHEVLCPTDVLTIKVHFPPGRPPAVVTGTNLIGVMSKRLHVAPTVSNEGDHKVATLEILRPKVGRLIQLKWRW